MHRPTVVTGVVLSVALALSACSSGGADVAASSSPPSASTTGSGTASPSGPAASGSTRAPFAILPESALQVIPDFAYVGAAGQDDQVLAQGKNESVAAVFGGAIARQLLYGGQEVGGVQLWRFREDVPASAKAQFLLYMVGGFGGQTPVTGTLNGIPVAQVEKARKSSVTAVGFLTGTDLVLVWAPGTEVTQRLALTYMGAAGIGAVPSTTAPSASAS